MIFLFKVVEDGYEFFAKRQLVTLFSAPNYCGEFDNAGGMMSVDETLMCSFQVSIKNDLTKKKKEKNREMLVLSFKLSRCIELIDEERIPFYVKVQHL